MTECNAIIEANNEIDRLKEENKKLNALCVKYGFEIGELEEENEQLKQEIMEWKEKYFYSEETVINEYSSNISKDMEELQKEVYGDVE